MDAFEAKFLERQKVVNEESNMQQNVRSLTLSIYEQIKRRKGMLEQLDRLRHDYSSITKDLDALAFALNASPPKTNHSNTEDDRISEDVLMSMDEPETSPEPPPKTIDYRHFNNADTCIKTLYGHQSTVNCLDFESLHGMLLTGSDDCTIRLWDLARWRPLRILYGHDRPVRALQLDGSFACSGAEDRRIKVWRLPSVHSTSLAYFDHSTEDEWLVSTLNGHYDSIQCLQMEANHNKLVSGSADGTVKIWDLQREECLQTLPHYVERVLDVKALWANQASTTIEHLTSPDSIQNPQGVTALQFYEHALTTGDHEGIIRLWDLRQPAKPASLLQSRIRATPLFHSTGQLSSAESTELSTREPSSRSTSPSRSTDSSRSRSASPLSSPPDHGCLRQIQAHSKAVSVIRFKDVSIVSAGKDQVIRCWDLRKQCEMVEEVRVKETVNGTTGLHVDATRFIVASGNEHITVRSH